MLAVVCLLASSASAHELRPRTQLVAAKLSSPILPTPAAKLLDVGVSTASETALLLLFLKLAAIALGRMSADSLASKALSQLTWILVVQGSSRLQGVCGQIGRTKQVLNPKWYDALEKPDWNPPAWAFPLAWIPLKLLQTAAANIAWQAVDRQVLSAPIVLFVLHLALGDVWNLQFFLKQRPLTGLFVIVSFWAVLLAATGTMYGASPLSAALVAPTCVWVLIAASLNLDVWYLNKDRAA